MRWETRWSSALWKSDNVGSYLGGKGRLQYVRKRYLKFAETGELLLKVGSDATRELWHYESFDGTFHKDGHKGQFGETWEATFCRTGKEGDPTWKGGKGKEAGLERSNYLASKRHERLPFSYQNIAGDASKRLPIMLDYDTYDSFLIPLKIDQWGSAFWNMRDKASMWLLHFKTWEHGKTRDYWTMEGPVFIPNCTCSRN